MKPTILQKLQHGKILCGKVFSTFVETWNYICRRVENIQGDADVNPTKGFVKVDNTDPEHPVIRLDNTNLLSKVGDADLEGTLFEGEGKGEEGEKILSSVYTKSIHDPNGKCYALYNFDNDHVEVLSNVISADVLIRTFNRTEDTVEQHGAKTTTREDTYTLKYVSLSDLINDVSADSQISSLLIEKGKAATFSIDRGQISTEIQTEEGTKTKTEDYLMLYGFDNPEVSALTLSAGQTPEGTSLLVREVDEAGNAFLKYKSLSVGDVSISGDSQIEDFSPRQYSINTSYHETADGKQNYIELYNFASPSIGTQSFNLEKKTLDDGYSVLTRHSEGGETKLEYMNLDIDWSDLSNALSDQLSDLSNQVSAMSVVISSELSIIHEEISSVSTVLSTEISNVINNISSLSTEISSVSTILSNEISVLNNEICAVSTILSNEISNMLSAGDSISGDANIPLLEQKSIEFKARDNGKYAELYDFSANGSTGDDIVIDAENKSLPAKMHLLVRDTSTNTATLKYVNLSINLDHEISCDADCTSQKSIESNNGIVQLYQFQQTPAGEVQCALDEALTSEYYAGNDAAMTFRNLEGGELAMLHKQDNGGSYELKYSGLKVNLPKLPVGDANRQLTKSIETMPSNNPHMQLYGFERLTAESFGNEITQSEQDKFYDGKKVNIEVKHGDNKLNLLNRENGELGYGTLSIQLPRLPLGDVDENGSSSKSMHLNKSGNCYELHGINDASKQPKTLNLDWGQEVSLMGDSDNFIIRNGKQVSYAGNIKLQMPEKPADYSGEIQSMQQQIEVQYGIVAGLSANYETLSSQVLSAQADLSSADGRLSAIEQSYVKQIVAGDGISISPAEGTGIITISVAGGSGSGDAWKTGGDSSTNYCDSARIGSLDSDDATVHNSLNAGYVVSNQGIQTGGLVDAAGLKTNSVLIIGGTQLDEHQLQMLLALVQN